MRRTLIASALAVGAAVLALAAPASSHAEWRTIAKDTDSGSWFTWASTYRSGIPKGVYRIKVNASPGVVNVDAGLWCEFWDYDFDSWDRGWTYRSAGMRSPFVRRLPNYMVTAPYGCDVDLDADSDGGYLAVKVQRWR